MKTDPGVVLGFTKVTNDKQSRSSRGMKYIVGGKSCRRTEVWTSIG